MDCPGCGERMWLMVAMLAAFDYPYLEQRRIARVAIKNGMKARVWVCMFCGSWVG